MAFWNLAKDRRIRIIIQAVPGASHTALAEVREDALRIRVAAAPDKGKANAELLDFLADSLGVRKSALELETGHTSRKKTVLVNGNLLSAVKNLGLAPHP